MKQVYGVTFVVLLTWASPGLLRAQPGDPQPADENVPTQQQTKAIVNRPFLDCEEGRREMNAQREREARLKMDKSTKESLSDFQQPMKDHEAEERRRQAAHQRLDAAFARSLA